MAERYMLAIDAGTTGVTAIVFDHRGRVCSRAYAEFTQHYPRAGWVEHDAEEILMVTLRVIGEALRDGRIRSDDLQGIGITNQRETVVLWDRASGQPLGRAIVWQDRRTAKFCDALRDRGLEAWLQERTGLLIDPYFSATKLHWLLEQDPDLRERARSGTIAFGTIDSWLVFRLSGLRAHVTDYSNASRTQLYNLHELRWDPDILDLLDIPAALLPEVMPSSWIYAHTDPELFPGSRPIPIAGIAGDQQAALFGQACHEPGMAKNTYGTGSFVLQHTGTTAVPSRQRLLTTIAWGIGDEPVEYAQEGAIFVTGAAVQWLRDGLGMIASATETEALARSVADNEGVYFVPALTGLGAPHWDPHARGLLIGLTRGTGKAQVARAVLESIAYQTRDVLEAMQRDSGIRLSELRCDGGAALNPVLMQFQADILDSSVVVPETVETTALGAAYLAGLATGFWGDRTELARHWRVRNRYTPGLPEPERERLYRRWLRAVDLSRGWAREDTDS
ncbi:glycerol kinase GlpK [Thioalkalivibrio nitratireducens]|nr:glycerol kinase GlpK [Thioalkalivibrio nitratireducens]